MIRFAEAFLDYLRSSRLDMHRRYSDPPRLTKEGLYLIPHYRLETLEDFVKDSVNYQRYFADWLSLWEDGMKLERDLWVPLTQDYYAIDWSSGLTYSFGVTRDLQEKPDPPEPEFEIDMIEPLIGWKDLTWVSSTKNLISSFNATIWHPMTINVAGCACKKFNGDPKHHAWAPAVHGTCGLYASDTIENSNWDAEEYNSVLCEVYGWGRYVRGDKGWRSQFMYFKAIHLTQRQKRLVKHLKKYQVPIFCQTEYTAYDPTWEGEDGYGQEEAARDFRTLEAAHAAEDYEEDTGEEA